MWETVEGRQLLDFQTQGGDWFPSEEKPMASYTVFPIKFIVQEVDGVKLEDERYGVYDISFVMLW